jgi:predicted transcriptional regulator
MYKSNVNCSVLKEQLAFLIKNSLVKEKTLKKERLVYEIAEKGFAVLKYFRELQTLLPIEEEDISRIPSILY